MGRGRVVRVDVVRDERLVGGGGEGGNGRCGVVRVVELVEAVRGMAVVRGVGVQM